jgi:hypothetical protein
MPHKGQGWNPWELNMIGEWVSRTFPDAEYRTQVRLGKIQPRSSNGTFSEDEERALGLWRRWADAIVFLNDRLLLVESVLRSDAGKISILNLYATLLPQTDELKSFNHLPIQKVLLYAIEDPVVNELARRENILPVLYVPTFFEAWLEKRRARDRRPSRTNL